MVDLGGGRDERSVPPASDASNWSPEDLTAIDPSISNLTIPPSTTPNSTISAFRRLANNLCLIESSGHIVRDPDKVQNSFTKGTRPELLDSNLAKLGFSLPTCLDTIRLFELDVWCLITYYFRIRVRDGNRRGICLPSIWRAIGPKDRG